MRITSVEESGYELQLYSNGVGIVGLKCPAGFTWDRGACILQVARDLRNFLLRGVQVTLCNGRFDFHNSDDPEALRAHLTAWGTKGKSVEDVEDEIIKWLKDQPKKSTVTLDTWECNGYRIIRMPFVPSGTFRIYSTSGFDADRETLTEALNYARRNS